MTKTMLMGSSKAFRQILQRHGRLWKRVCVPQLCRGWSRQLNRGGKWNTPLSKKRKRSLLVVCQFFGKTTQGRGSVPFWSAVTGHRFPRQQLVAASNKAVSGQRTVVTVFNSKSGDKSPSTKAVTSHRTPNGYRRGEERVPLFGRRISSEFGGERKSGDKSPSTKAVTSHRTPNGYRHGEERVPLFGRRISSEFVGEKKSGDKPPSTKAVTSHRTPNGYRRGEERAPLFSRRISSEFVGEKKSGVKPPSTKVVSGHRTPKKEATLWQRTPNGDRRREGHDDRTPIRFPTRRRDDSLQMSFDLQQKLEQILARWTTQEQEHFADFSMRLSDIHRLLCQENRSTLLSKEVLYGTPLKQREYLYDHV